MAKIIFFGTHEFGAAILDSLLKSEHKIVAVITQPDRAVGRKQELQKSPVKILAEQNKINIFQPETLKNFELPHLDVDLNIVCQYGLIIPKNIIDKPKFGSLNVHTSLLPKLRGASPIQSAIISGENTTGVTIMQMDEKLDHGGILAQKSVPIEKNDTYLSLSGKMTPAAQGLLLKTVDLLLQNKINPIPQDESKATYCKIFTREDGKIEWTKKTAKEIYNFFRGLSPWPGIWTTWKGKRIKLLDIEPEDEDIAPGQVIFASDKMLIGAKEGSIKVKTLQLEGKKPMDPRSIISGHKELDKSFLD